MFIQRFDSALRLNIHAHLLALDGVYSGLVSSPSDKGELRLRYSGDSADVLFPRLFLAE